MDKADSLLRERLIAHVRMLSETIGDRSTGKYTQLVKAEKYIVGQLKSLGFSPDLQEYIAGSRTVRNIIARLLGRDEHLPKLVIGAHYDTCNNPGADDNASAVAGLLEIARQLKKKGLQRSLEFVFFVNEEPPYFQSKEMGSMVYVTRAKGEGKQITGAVILEMIGYYSQVKGSQKYPALLGQLLPDTGNFLGAVGNFASKSLVETFARGFRQGTTMQLIPFAEDLPLIDELDWSDHSSFWLVGIPAIMITDTSLFRNPHYHTARDTWDTLDNDLMTRAVQGIARAIIILSN